MPATNPMPVLASFGLDMDKTGLERVSGGYINETYQVSIGGKPVYILQRINTEVFPDGGQVMENLVTMLPYLQGPGYTGLTLEPTTTGNPWLETDEGAFWRLFHYIPNSGTHESTDNPEVSREAGRILGTFHQLALQAPLEKIDSPLPRFHDLEWRAQQLEKGITTGIRERIEEAGRELSQSRELVSFCRDIPFSEFPIRICHNDTKLSNILYDLGSQKALCLIDLDTLMPGCLLYDFGDAARTLLNPLPESYPTRRRAQIDLTMFGAFVRGWRESGIKMEDAEAQWLAHGVVLMPALHGVRALTDYLTGDRYYHTTFPGQNLVRAKNLLGFADQAREALPEMQGILRKNLG